MLQCDLWLDYDGKAGWREFRGALQLTSRCAKTTSSDRGTSPGWGCLAIRPAGPDVRGPASRHVVRVSSLRSGCGLGSGRWASWSPRPVQEPW
jgi:hypothetical protein